MLINIWAHRYLSAQISAAVSGYADASYYTKCWFVELPLCPTVGTRCCKCLKCNWFVIAVTGVWLKVVTILLVCWSTFGPTGIYQLKFQLQFLVMQMPQFVELPFLPDWCCLRYVTFAWLLILCEAVWDICWLLHLPNCWCKVLFEFQLQFLVMQMPQNVDL